MKRTTIILAVVLAAVGSYFGTELAQRAYASRSSSGTYSLPAGNPVTTGTTITSSLWNNTHADIATELTNSLDRNGRGAMTAPFQLVSGTNTAPGLTFASETNSGLYRAGAGDVRMQVGATQVQKWTTAGITVPGSCAVQNGETVTTTTTNATAITATGNGTGNGVGGTGGATSGAGLYGTGGAPNGRGVTGIGTGTGPGVAGTGGATNGPGVQAQGTGTGAGVTSAGGSSAGIGVYGAGGTDGVGTMGQGNGIGPGIKGLGGTNNTSSGTNGENGSGGFFVGAGGSSGGRGVTAIGGASTSRSGVMGIGGSSSGTGVTGTGGASNGYGVVGNGTGSGIGGSFSSVSGYAVEVGTGNAHFTASNPSSSTGFSNTLTPKNLVKAWARVSADGAGNATVVDGFNVSGCSISTVTLTCTFATAMSDANYAPLVTLLDASSIGGLSAFAKSTSTSALGMRGHRLVTSTPTAINFATDVVSISFAVLGTQ